MVTKLATILYLPSNYYLLSVLCEKHFLEIGPLLQKLWSFKCMMLKTLNSNFLDWEDTLSWPARNTQERKETTENAGVIDIEWQREEQ